MASENEWNADIRPDPSDSLAFEAITPRPKPKSRWKLWAGLGVLALLMGGGAGAVLLFLDDFLMDEDHNIPLVRADDQPLKVRPADPGGMDVPNRDKSVYTRMGAQQPAGAAVERLLPDPETPREPPKPVVQADIPPLKETAPTPTEEDVASLQRPAPLAAPETLMKPGSTPSAQTSTPSTPVMAPTAPTAMTSTTPEQPEKLITTPAKPVEVTPAPKPEPKPEPKPAPETPKPTQLAPKPTPLTPKPTQLTPKPASTPVAKPDAEPKPAPKPAAVASAPAQPKPQVQEPKPAPTAIVQKPAPKPMVGPIASLGGYRVQLAAVRYQDMAEKEWNRLARKHKDLLGGLGHTIMRIDLGAKGIFYRLRTSAVGAKEDAVRLCDALKERKVGCLIVRPE